MYLILFLPSIRNQENDLISSNFAFPVVYPELYLIISEINVKLKYFINIYFINHLGIPTSPSAA